MSLGRGRCWWRLFVILHFDRRALRRISGLNSLEMVRSFCIVVLILMRFGALIYCVIALIDLVVMNYLFKKFPRATSGQLSWARSRAVCSPALASVAVNRLGLHRMLLINNVELSIAISKYVPILEETSNEDIILNGWKHDPPKAISDATAQY